MKSTYIRRTLAAVTTGVIVAGLSACDFDGAYDLPLPGSPIDHDQAFTVTAEFTDVLNVVPRSPVYVSDVTVGEVTEVERVGWHAKVTMVIRDDVELPDNVVAEIRQTSLLGEKYVDLAAPAKGARGRLEEGDAIPLAATGRNPEVEEVLGALSFLLTGGGVGQLQTITSELNNVMTGRTDNLRHLLGELETLVGTLDDQKGDIIRAMEAINSLTKTLNREKKTIQGALEATGPALKVLKDQHGQLMTMLEKLDELGVVGTRVINGSKENLLKDLAHLQPILRQLNAAGDSLPRGLSMMISFPFPQEAADIAFGDYANAAFALDLDLSKQPAPGSPGDPGGPGLPEVPGLPGLPDLPGDPSLPEVPGLPGLPGIGGASSTGGNPSGGGLLEGGFG